MQGNRYLTKRYDDRLEAYRIIDNKAFKITHVFDFDKEYFYNSSYEDCFYSGVFYYYLNKNTCNTIGFRMLVGKQIDGLELWYSQPTIKIYKFLPSSS